MTQTRYWLGGPCEENGKEVWLVVDTTVTRGHSTIVFQGTKAQCERRIDVWNDHEDPPAPHLAIKVTDPPQAIPFEGLEPRYGGEPSQGCTMAEVLKDEKPAMFTEAEAKHHAEAMRQAHLNQLLPHFLNTPPTERPRFKGILGREDYKELERMAGGKG